MEAQMAAIKLKRALSYAVRLAADRSYELGDKVLVWRDKIVTSRIGEQFGPFSVLDVDYDKKLVCVRDDTNSPARPFNVAQVKP